MDWGLGHATRCIPIIRYLLEKGCAVTLAADGKAALLLRDNFPDLPLLNLPGYNIQYSKKRLLFTAKILLQIPKILKAIKSERNWLRAAQEQHSFDLILSDNRYGLKLLDVPSVIMTHQLMIQSGRGKGADGILQRLHYKMLERFDHCWVVDHKGDDGIGGKLSQPGTLPRNARYIGLLSQMENAVQNNQPHDKKILILLSGPEPMRTILEEKIVAQIKNLPKYTFTIVAGNPLGKRLSIDNVRYFTHLNAVELQKEMQEHSLIVCRSGYSTLMDLAALGKRALLIPTPGQSEQEYLAKYLQEKGLFFTQKQAKINLENDIEIALGYAGFKKVSVNENMRKAVDDVLLKL